MAIKAKAELRSDINANLPDNTTGLITPALDRDLRLDAIDSLIAPSGIVSGAGIAVSNNGDGTVTVSAGGAAAASGIPSFVVESAAQPSDDLLTGVIAGLSDSPPFPSLVYLLTPNVLNRAADDLELRINGDVSRVRSLVDYLGDELAARDMEPGALYEILAHASPTQQYRLTEPIPVRRQDFDVAFAWTGQGIDLDDAAVTAGATFAGTVVDIPDRPAGTASGTRARLWFGVPADAPDISVAWNGVALSPFIAATAANQVGGVAYKWWYYNGQYGWDARTVDVTILPY